MSFAHPWILLLLLVPAVALIYEILRRGHAVRIPVDFSRRRSSRAAAILLGTAAVFPAIVLAMAVIVLAGPKVSGPPKEERSVTNIEIVLDVSGSMGAPFPGKPGANRYTAAMEAIEGFTSRRTGDAAGLTIFGTNSIRWLPLTKDLRAIRTSAPFCDPAHQPPGMGGTAVGKALQYVGGLLAAQPKQGDRLIIVVTDGQSDDLEGGAGRQIGMELAADNIVIYAINVGGGEMPQTLRDVSAPTGGQAFNATDAGALEGVFAHINKMQPTKIKQGAPEPVDHVRPFALAGLIGLGLHQLCLMGVRSTPW